MLYVTSQLRTPHHTVMALSIKLLATKRVCGLTFPDAKLAINSHITKTFRLFFNIKNSKNRNGRDDGTSGSYGKVRRIGYWNLGQVSI